MKEKKTIKICLLTMGEYPVPATGGGAVETLTENLVETFEQRDYNCSVHVISCYTPQAAEKAEAYPKTKFHFITGNQFGEMFYRLRRRAVHKLFGYTVMHRSLFFSKAIEIIRRNRFDVVIVENAVHFVEPLKRLTNSKIILHLHNDYDELTEQPAGEVIGRADLVIAVSDYVAKNLQQHADFHAPIVTLRNVVDTQQFAANDETREKAAEIRRKFGFAEDDIVCLFAGRLRPEKGIHLLLDAVVSIDNPHLKLLIVGGSSFSDSAETKFVKELHAKADTVPGRVAFAGYIGHQEMKNYYCAGDIAVFPSQWDEAAGLVVLEAQSMGMATVIADSGGMPEYVNDKSAVVIQRSEHFTEDLKNAITQLTDNAALREQLESAGIAQAKVFDKHNYFDAMFGKLQKVKTYD